MVRAIGTAGQGSGRYAQVGVLLVALGCGRAGDETPELLEIGTLRGPGYLAPEGSGPSGSGGAGLLPPGADGGGSGVAPEVYPGERALLDVVERACGGCHSGAPGDAAGDLFSIDSLRDRGWLWPGAGEASQLAVWLQYGYGDARPGHSGFDAEFGDYRAVVDFINGMPQTSCPAPPPRGRDEATAAMLSDIQSRDPADRPFIRYVGVAHASSSAACGTYAEQFDAMVQLLNGVSLGPRVVSPATVDGAFIAVVDLRDYAWNRAIDFGWGDVPGGTFSDGWEALVAAAKPFAQELTGPEADALKLATGTAIPYVPAHVFVAVASTGDLYHSLVGLDSNVATTRDALGVSDDGLRRAGMFAAAGAPYDRAVVRRVQGGDPTRSWWTREWIDGDVGGLHQNPVDYPQSGQELMFELPNGLYAYAITTADGTRVAQEPSCTGAVCDPAVAAESSVTCRGCHRSGHLFLPPDELRTFADENPSAYDANTLARIREQYRPGELGELFDADTARHRASFQFADDEFVDIIGGVYHEFYLRPIDAPSAAAELGVTLDELLDVVPALDNATGTLIGWLSGGSVDRYLFRTRFQSIACAIGGSRNVPAGCP
ncbi:MAG TPA: hypothetical protein VMG12_15050 [Polyangiaceae bacterium]|nr:hypothetical protein [Polyangiaceae bacterium]